MALAIIADHIREITYSLNWGSRHSTSATCICTRIRYGNTGNTIPRLALGYLPLWNWPSSLVNWRFVLSLWLSALFLHVRQYTLARPLARPLAICIRPPGWIWVVQWGKTIHADRSSITGGWECHRLQCVSRRYPKGMFHIGRGLHATAKARLLWQFPRLWTL